jgi:DNA-binding transcriptional LysR family regulator
MTSGWETELRIAVDTIFGLQVLYPLIPAFDMLCSGTRLTLCEEALAGCWDALENDRADLIIGGMGAGGIPSGGGYDTHLLGRLAFDYAVAPTHPLAALAQRLDSPIADEHIHPFRATSVADTSRTQSVRTIGLLAGQDTLTVATMRDKVIAQIAGLGVGFLPRFLAEPEFQKGSLVRLQVEQPRPDASFCIAHRPGVVGKAGRWFIEKLSTDPSVFPMLELEAAMPKR